MEEMKYDILDLQELIRRSILKIANTEFYIGDINGLNSEILTAMKELELKISEFELLVEESDEYEKKQKDIYEYNQQLKMFKEELKAANLSYMKKSKTVFMRQMRNQLLPPLKGNTNEGRQHYIFKSLARTKKNLLTDLEIGSDSIFEIKKSGEIMKHTMGLNIDTIDDAIESRKIIGNLDRKAVITKLVNMGSFCFFVIVAIYVFNRRLPFFSWLMILIWPLIGLIMKLVWAIIGFSGDLVMIPLRMIFSKVSGSSEEFVDVDSSIDVNIPETDML